MIVYKRLHGQLSSVFVIVFKDKNPMTQKSFHIMYLKLTEDRYRRF